MLTIAGVAASTYSCMSDSQKDKQDFKYLIDEFADIKIISYRVPGWENLSLSEKEYIYHLAEAAKSGRDIIWSQNFKYNLEIRGILEKIIREYKGDKSSKEYEDFLIYTKRVVFSNGIHHHYAEDKIIPTLSQEYFESLMNSVGLSDKCKRFLPIIFDKHLYPQRKYTGSKEDLLLASSVNFYDGVSKEEALRYYNKKTIPKDKTPISYGLNSRLVNKNGDIYEEVYKIDGLYGPAIERIVSHLIAAQAVAENEIQKDYIEKLIEYYQTGDLRLWDDYNIAWVQDTKSQIDFINGFVETYNDPMGMKATWEAVVNFKDIEASKRTQIISDNAQWFEDHSPIDDRFKKKEVKGVSAKVITVVSLGGDSYPSCPLGINLPNSDWIRKDYGSKSVSIANITSAHDKATAESPKSMLIEFAWDQAEVNMMKEYGLLTTSLHTDLHECLGHGSGQLLPSTCSNALAEYSSTLEESRADLFALYYISDPKLVELGVLPDNDAYKAEYSSYIKNGLFTQFVRIELGKKNTQAHMQNRKIICQWCYENGLKDNIIEKRIRDGKTYFVINDYQGLRELFGKLLIEIQRIKSEGDYNAGKNLVERYAINIDPELHKEVKERFNALGLKPYTGFVNPNIIPILENGKTIDYKLEYPTNYLQQMLDYSEKYGTL